MAGSSWRWRPSPAAKCCRITATIDGHGGTGGTMRSARCLVLVAALSGCWSAKPYETAAVSGRVTLNGKPLAGARVTFQPQHDPRQGPLSGPESHGMTDSEGNYTLTTVFQDKGAAVGRHRVMISTRRLERPAN